jgi:hypothetical protein
MAQIVAGVPLRDFLAAAASRQSQFNLISGAFREQFVVSRLGLFFRPDC